MTLFFVLWRAAIIVLLGFAISELYGWSPAPLLFLVLFAIAGDSVATLYAVWKRPGQKP
jgi:hypothetical protein